MSSLPSAAAEELYVLPLLHLQKWWKHQNESMTTLLCTTKHYSSSTLYYKVLLHTAKYYSSSAPVLQSTTPVQLCKHSTSPYYKVLLGTRKTYSVLRPILQSTTPVLLCTTKCYSTPYYKALLQYYSVLAKFHQMLRLPQKLTLQHHQIMRLPREVTPQHDQILPPAKKSDTVTVHAVTSDQKLRSQATKTCGHKRPPAPIQNQQSQQNSLLVGCFKRHIHKAKRI